MQTLLTIRAPKAFIDECVGGIELRYDKFSGFVIDGKRVCLSDVIMVFEYIAMLDIRYKGTVTVVETHKNSYQFSTCYYSRGGMAFLNAIRTHAAPRHVPQVITSNQELRQINASGPNELFGRSRNREKLVSKFCKKLGPAYSRYDCLALIGQRLGPDGDHGDSVDLEWGLEYRWLGAVKKIIKSTPGSHKDWLEEIMLLISNAQAYAIGANNEDVAKLVLWMRFAKPYQYERNCIAVYRVTANVLAAINHKHIGASRIHDVMIAVDSAVLEILPGFKYCAFNGNNYAVISSAMRQVIRPWLETRGNKEAMDILNGHKFELISSHLEGSCRGQ